MPAQVLFEAPITFAAVGNEQTHAPMVHAAIHGIPTKLILDTGCTDHILTAEVAEQAGLEAQPGEAGTDSTGASVPSWTLGEVGIQIGDEPFDLRDVVAISAPPPFIGWGIGGFLSPQHLHPTAWAVLDLVDDGFFLVEADEADMTAWLTARSPALRLQTLERQPGDSTILVRGAIDPFDAVVTMLDSGARRTSFTAAAVPGASGPRQTAGRGVGGEANIGSEVADQTLVIGEARLPLGKLIVQDEMDGRDGLVGMDVLRGTVLTVSGDPNRSVLWQMR